MTTPFEAGGYGFVPATRADLPLLYAWLSLPHVQEWWGDPDEEIDLIREGLAMDWVESYLVSMRGTPFAYLQTWDLFGEPGYRPFPEQPPGTRGIDPFIGPPHMVGLGYGSRMLSTFMTRCFEQGAHRFVIDPDPANGRAIAAYCRAGFVPQGERDTDEGRILFMVRDSGRFGTVQ
jgi:aminoglycoside 6'-N-acetyltransferase